MRTLPPLPDPRMRLVVDIDDHMEHHRALLSVHDLNAGRVVCQVKPGRQDVANFAACVLEGLGKNLDLKGNHSSSAANWRRSALWLNAECVSELIVLRAQFLDRRGWARMVDLAAQASCGLTLVLSGCELDGRRQQYVNTWPFERMSFTQWRASYGKHWASSRTDASVRSRARPFPPLPTDDFTLFRASCKARLTDDDFAVVDRTWRAAWARAGAWMKTQAGLSETNVAGYLRDQVRTAGSYGEVLTILRAAQAAIFLAGWLVKVNHERLTASALQEPYDLLTPETAELLRGFVVPRFAAAATLALVLREPPESIATLRVEDVIDDGRRVQWHSDAVAVPEHFATFLRAQRYERAGDGAHSDAPLFTSSAGGRSRRSQGQVVPMTGQAIKATLRTVARETGALVTTEFSGRSSNADAHNWAFRRGVSVVALRDSDAAAKARNPLQGAA